MSGIGSAFQSTLTYLGRVLDGVRYRFSPNGMLTNKVSQMTKHGMPAEGDLALIRRYGLAFDCLITIPVQELQFQYRSEWSDEPYLIDQAGNVDRAITSSPMYRLLRDYKEQGGPHLFQHFAETDYYKMLRWRSDKGFKIDWATGRRVSVSYSDREILSRIRKLVATFESIRLHGYLGGRYAHRLILVLDKPYERQRFGRVVHIPPYEIFSGHHRAACLAGLGYQTAKVGMLRLLDAS